MRWVDQAVTRPHRCAILPYIGNGAGHAFLDTGQDLDREHIYVSDVAIDEMARLRGFIHPGHFREQQERLIEIKRQLEEQQAELAELREFKENTHGLARHGLMLKRPPGRPPKKKEEEVEA